MVMMRDIRRAAGNIARRFRPHRITLFGSYAYGRPNENSDVDLLILMAGHSVHDRGIHIREQIEFGFPVDLLVRSPAEFKRRIALGDCFLREIQEKGKILYEAADARMGGKGGRGFSNRSARNAGEKIAKLR
jgi:predicted nucleotidyltransferase